MALTIETALEEHRVILKKVSSLEQELRAVLEREAILKGHIERLDAELANSKTRADHYLRWNVEITRQLHNIGIFVSDALNMARQEVAQGNGSAKVMHEAERAIEKALEIGHEPVQREGER